VHHQRITSVALSLIRRTRRPTRNRMV